MANILRIILPACFIIFMWSVAAIASTASLDQLKEKADAGDASALNELGHAYRRGTGVEKDLEASVDFFRRSVEAGNVRALVWQGRTLATLGRVGEALKAHNRAVDLDAQGAAQIRAHHHVNGRYGEFSDAEFGLSELERLVAGGDASAMFTLADALDGGSAQVPENFQRAFELYSALAEAGNPRAQERYAGMLAGGKGTTVNLEAAEKWLKVAISNGRTNAATRLSELLVARGAFLEAVQTLESLRSEDPESIGYRLGRMHVRGEFGPASSVKDGIHELETLSAQGHSRSTQELARLLRREEPTAISQVNHDEIAERLDVASERGDSRATLALLTLLRASPERFSDARTRRQRILDERGPDLAERHLVAEQIRLLAETQLGRDRFAALLDLVTNTRSERAFSSALLTTYYVDRNAYTWVMQTILRDQGYYKGAVNGYMTKSTISAIRAACKDAGVDDICSQAVLRSSSIRAISPYLAQLR